VRRRKAVSWGQQKEGFPKRKSVENLVFLLGDFMGKFNRILRRER